LGKTVQTKLATAVVVALVVVAHREVSVGMFVQGTKAVLLDILEPGTAQLQSMLPPELLPTTAVNIILELQEQAVVLLRQDLLV
jgi:hypothetical protein